MGIPPSRVVSSRLVSSIVVAGLNVSCIVVTSIVLLAIVALTVPASGYAFDGSMEVPPFEPVNADFNQALTLVKRGNLNGAVPLLEKVVRENDQNVDAYHMLGDSLRQLERYDEALRNYERALAIVPRHLGTHASIGQAYLALNRPEQAKRHLAVLDDTCWFGCREYDTLKQAIEQYEARGGA